MKTEMEKKAQETAAEFAGEDDDKRALFEGLRPGVYVRIQIDNVSVHVDIILFVDNNLFMWNTNILRWIKSRNSF